MSRDRIKKPSLLPKEHGAYAELSFPLVTGLTLTAPSPAALALGASAVAFFLANEPAAVLLGARGKRLKEQLGERARRRGGFLLAAGSLLGAAGLLGAGASVWPAILLPVLAVAALIPMVLTGRQKTLPGEFLVVTAFSTLLLPLAGASGADPGRAAAAAGVWWMSFALGTLEVHAIKARLKDRGKRTWTRFASPLASGITALAAMIPTVAPDMVATTHPCLASSAAALLPPALAVFLLSLIGVHPRHLKRVGWTLVAANGLALGILLLG